MGVPDREAMERIRKEDIIDRKLDYLIVKLGCCDWYSKRVKKVALLEFDRGRKSMGVIVRTHNGANKLLVKGAVENILERSSYVQLSDGTVVTLDGATRERLLSKLNAMSSKALRCLAFAYKEDLGNLSSYDGEGHLAHAVLLDPTNYSTIESGLVFVGMVGLRDPPREEVHKVIYDCMEAGIRVVVITGDNKNTAEAICREIGVFTENEDLKTKSFTGKEFLALSEVDCRRILSAKGGALISRAEPKHKQEIVRMLKDAGKIVAMTGDGVNDAPALKLADIGVAMGISGTEVAMEALVDFCRQSTFMPKMYANFDCDITCSNIFEELGNLLAKSAFPVTCPLSAMHILALEGLIAVIHSMAERAGASGSIIPVLEVANPNETQEYVPFWTLK
ncbi:hypothetical protein KP509_11G070300 [Ceratopteris richardii]|uniref:Uncharacterized protein n=1 Tax=Ceratopteris richardii TaxID=49495 RepID=A0A8T2TTP3_CERRI|nr:hypothetical protein KP509_11G070300 [Ceratopteris richardii]